MVLKKLIQSCRKTNDAKKNLAGPGLFGETSSVANTVKERESTPPLKAIEIKNIFVDPLFVWASEKYSNDRARAHGALNNHQWCHLWAGDESAIEALHALAKKIGLKREWFQNKKDFPHYDLVPAKRKLAIDAGAVEMNLQDWLRSKKVTASSELPDIVAALKDPQCPVCHSLDVWLPRVPGIDASNNENWRCFKCAPPSTPLIIKERRGASANASDGSSATTHARNSNDEERASVVAEESAACSVCLGRWVVETPGPAGIRRTCFTCRTPIDPKWVSDQDRNESGFAWNSPFRLAFEEKERAKLNGVESGKALSS